MWKRYSRKVYVFKGNDHFSETAKNYLCIIPGHENTYLEGDLTPDDRRSKVVYNEEMINLLVNGYSDCVVQEIF